MIQLLHRMKAVRRELSRWSRTAFDDIFEKLKKGEDNATKQEEAYTECDSDQNREAVNLAQAQLKRRVAIEEEFWKQKARTKWDVDRDKNFKYFHACVASRRKKLNLHSIEGEHRARLSEQVDIRKQAISYLSKLFTKQHVKDSLFLNAIPKIISTEENQSLSKPPLRRRSWQRSRTWIAAAARAWTDSWESSFRPVGISSS